MISVGIDLGTTNSLVSVFLEDGSVEFVENDIGEILTPSALALDDEGVVITGAAAKHRLIQYPKTTFSKFKRSIGTQEQFKLGKKSVSATDLSALLLQQLRRDIVNKFDDEIGEVVISVPAYFNSVQRQETKLAAMIAGFEVSRLINEPTAAALAYGLQDRTNESLFIVLDLGGGTFDVSILEMFEGVMEVRASSGDAFLGGEDFTETLAQHFASEHGYLWGELSAQARTAFYAASEAIKCKLSAGEAATSKVPIDGKEVELSITLAEFEVATKALSLRIRKPIERCLYDASLSFSQIERIILVGGATRMTLMRSLVARMFKKLPERTLNPDTVVAQGAAIQAALSADNEALEDVVTTDVSPFSLGIKAQNRTQFGVVDDAFFPIIERNTILPASRMQIFSTLADNQPVIEIMVYQGESPMADDNILLGQLSVAVPRMPAGREHVQVRFSYDVSGLLQVEVTVNSTQKTHEILIEGSAKNMTKKDIEKRLKVLAEYKINPRENAKNQEALENLKHLYAMHLGDDRAKINDLISIFETALSTQDPREIDRVRDQIYGSIKQFEENYVT